MIKIIPNYYHRFACIQSACRHNCCIGWEIDIDEDTAAYYRGISGPLGRRLSANISNDDPPHFLLNEKERCPFLNKDNLCDIILELGENHICEICAQHPRFHNQLPGRTESGLGLCCEEAARLILSQKEPVFFSADGDLSSAPADEIISYRDEVIAQLQNRSLPLKQRLLALLPEISIDITHWLPCFFELETLDPAWTQRLQSLVQHYDYIDWTGFSVHMTHRMHEYEQLLVYLIYRHMANAPALDDADVWVAFAILSYQLIYALGAAHFSLCGEFSFTDQTELARLFSSEIEYSEDNLYAIFDELYNIYFTEDSTND